MADPLLMPAGGSVNRVVLTPEPHRHAAVHRPGEDEDLAYACVRRNGDFVRILQPWQQRVGVARALASRPDLLLMDEPFGALDPIIRTRAQEDLRHIQQRLGSTIMLVTHDMEEAIRLGDRVAVMDGGHLVQHGTPAEIIAAPATDFVADMVGDVERPLRLLSLIPVAELVEEGSAEGEALPADASLRDALSACLWTGRAAVPVAKDGVPMGRVTLDAIRARAGQHA